jgi:hypothetical protein
VEDGGWLMEDGMWRMEDGEDKGWGKCNNDVDSITYGQILRPSKFNTAH